MTPESSVTLRMPTRELSRCQCCGTQTVIASRSVPQSEAGLARVSAHRLSPGALPPAQAGAPRQRQLSSQAAISPVSSDREVMPQPNDHVARSDPRRGQFSTDGRGQFSTGVTVLLVSSIGR